VKALPALTALAPVLYLTVVVAATALSYGFALPAGARNFDDYTVWQATEEFAVQVARVAVGGLAIGSLCSGVLSLMARTMDQRGAA
jgi:hypothetical protein